MEYVSEKVKIDKKNIMLIIFILIIVAILISINTGTIRLSPIKVFETLIGKGTKKSNTILFDFRLPRIVMAMLVGAGLAVSGNLLQSISRNNLADPGILGINSGAGLAVAAYIMFTSKEIIKIPMMMPLIALLGALISAFIIYLISGREGVSPVKLSLVGIGVDMALKAIMLLLSIKMDPRTHTYITVWISGSIWGTNWKYVLAVLPWILLLFPYVIYKSRVLNVLNLGEEVATGIGLHVNRERLYLMLTSVALAGACVALGGGIPFVGLIVPHMARIVVGPKHQYSIPTSALLGALVLLIADTIGRNLISPGEIPAGIVVSAIGAPYFIYLLSKVRT
jgi:iron complex transport system permease protein